MKICQLLDYQVFLTNEESEFVNNHSKQVSIEGLKERDEVIARNLVRKGIYEISKDSQYIIKKSNETSS